jgi:hypothetical protein
MNIEKLKQAPGLNAKSLADLKAGDFVFFAGSTQLKALQIERITPTGLIVTSYGTFNQDGRIRGSGAWSRHSIEPLIDQHIERLQKQDTISAAQKLIDSLSAEKWTLTYERAAVIVAALTDEPKMVLTENDIRISDGLIIDEDRINAYIEQWSDLDKWLGIQMRETEDYVNIYADYYPETARLEVYYCIHRTDGTDSDKTIVPLADSEKELILRLMREQGLDDCVREMKQDSGLELK